MSAIDTLPEAIAPIRRRLALAWRTGADRARAGTPHPRAASGLARWGADLALVQDDACAIARVDPRDGRAEALALPAIAGHVRFDPGFGDKRHKPDLESLVAVGDALWAFGSGSTSARERLAIVPVAPGAPPRFVALPAFYSALRDHPGFAGGALNLEGVAVARGRLWLFQRGNGGAFPALCHCALADFADHLAGGPVPALGPAFRVALGTLDGVPLGFTDAAHHDHEVWWLASAEASPDTYDDGVVVGSAVGRIDADGRVLGRASITEADGTPFRGKAEGLALDGDHAFVAVDPDDPERPAELLVVDVSALRRA